MGQSKPFRPTAIIVEDDDIQREMLALLLEQRNFDVLQCEDAETAALALKVKHPALIVTDINLVGKMDGVDLAHFARQQNADVRIIVISGVHCPVLCRPAQSSSPSRSIRRRCSRKRHHNRRLPASGEGVILNPVVRQAAARREGCMNERDFEQQLKDDGFQEIEYQKFDPRPGRGRHRHQFQIRGLGDLRHVRREKNG